MTELPAATTATTVAEPSDSAVEAPTESLVEDVLVEEVSIDGMRGVY